MPVSPTPRYEYVPSGKIWPSGDFSCGRRRVDWAGGGKPDLRGELRRIDDGDYLNLPDGWEYRGRGRVAFDPDYDGRVRWSDADAWIPATGGGPAVPLTLASVPNSHTASKRPERYGRNGITGLGKKMVKSAATLIQRKYGASRTTFCTISFPALPKNLRAELARCWPELLRQLVQWLSRRLGMRGVGSEVCSVTEIQPKRLEECGEAYLHLHLIWGNQWARAGNWAVSANQCRAWVESFLIRKGLWLDDSWVRVNVQPVYKSAAAYLAKYMSKGTSEIEAMAADLGWDVIPSQWWNMSKAARDWVKRETVSGRSVGELLEGAICGLFEFGGWYEMFWSLHEAMLDLGSRRVGVGWYGCLRESFRQDLLQLLDGAA